MTPMISALVASVVMAVCAARLKWWPVAALVSIALILLLSPGVWSRASTGYAQDSYWTLSIGGRLGVLAISLTLIAAFYGLIWAIARPLPPPIRTAVVALGGASSFLVLYGLTPQVFYSFYLLLFPDLPNQWVVSIVPDPMRIVVITEMRMNGALADHLSGAAFWGIFPFALWALRQG